MFLRWRQVWAISFVFWSVYAILDSAGSYAVRTLAHGNQFRSNVLVWSFGEAWVWVLATPLIWAITRSYSFTRERWKRSLLVHIGTGWLVSCTCCGLLLKIDDFMGWGLPHMPFYLRLVSFSFGDLPRYYVTVAIAQIIMYYVTLRTRETDLARLETALAQAQLQILRAQLSPHFLFNALNSIASLSVKDPRGAEAMTLQLSRLLRVSLESSARQKIPLGEEIEFLRNYIAIQQTRFRDRLTVDMDVDPRLLSEPVPSLVLQPLVENAIRHGIAKSSAPGHIHITAVRERDHLRIEILDNGVGVDTRRVAEGLGLSNTRERLQRLYGAGYRFDLDKPTAGGCRVVLSIPLAVVAEAA